MSILCILLLFTLTLGSGIKTSQLKWDIDWRSSDLNLIPPLPIAAPNSVNPQCRQDSLQLIEALTNMTLWAEQMWDASAKAPVGLVSGSRFQLGDYDECLSIQTPLEAQYCLVDVKIHVPPGHNTTDPFAIEYDPNTSLWDKMYYGGSSWKIPLDEAKWALCVPASCEPQDIEANLQTHLASLNYSKISVSVNPRLCSLKNRYYDQFFISDIIFSILMLSLIGLMVSSTLYDFICYQGHKDWKWNVESRWVDVMMCFSARRAVRSMTRRRTDIKNFNLKPLSGITFISCIIITAGHRWGFRYSGPLQNVVVNESVYYNWFALLFIGHMDLFVDVFFTVSGCVAVFFILNRMETHSVKFWQIVLVRYCRLTPVYAIVLFFYATLYYKMGDGPLWNLLVGTDMENCKKVWWTNLLYINNYVHADQLCGFHTWFMPCEFQFGLAVIPLCYLFHYRPRTGINVAYAALAVAIAIPFYVTYAEQLNGNLIFNARFFIQPQNDAYFAKFYMKTYTRAGPYILGSILGYVLHNYKGEKLSSSRTWGYGLVGGVTMMLAWGSGSYFYYPYTEYNVWLSALYGATIRSIWSLGLCMVLYVMLIGSQTFVHSILSWRPFTPLSAIGFNVYLLNTILPTTTTASLRNNDHYNLVSYLIFVIGDFGMDMIFGFLLYVCAERPFRLLGINIQKIVENKSKPDPSTLAQISYDNKVKVATEHL